MSSFTTAYTGIPTTANTTSEAGWTSHPRHSFITPSHPIQSSAHAAAPGSGQSPYPLGLVDNYNVPNHGASAVNTGATSVSWYPDPTIPRLNGPGQEAGLQSHANAQFSYVSASSVGTDAHSDYTGIRLPCREPTAYIDPHILTATNGVVSSGIACSDGAADTMDGLPLLPPSLSDNFYSHSDKVMVGNFGDQDLALCGVGGAFNSSPILSYQTAQQTTPDNRHGHTNYTATGPLSSQQPFPTDFSIGYQGEGTTNFTCVVPQPDFSTYHDMPDAIDTTAGTNPTTPFSTTGPTSARAEPHPTWQPGHMESQLSTLRNPRASQAGPVRPPAMSSVPSRLLPTKSNRNDAVFKERGRRKKRFSPEKKYRVKRRKVGRTVCTVCRNNRVEV